MTVIPKKAEEQIKPERYDRLVSLGRYCQTAYQIRRFTGDPIASYFDWIGTPHDGLVQTLQGEFRECFLLDNLSVTNDGLGVVDRRTGLDFRHAFSVPRYSSRVDLKTFANEYETARKKETFLRLRWKKTIRHQHALYIRQDTPSREEILELYDVLANQARLNRIGLLVVAPPGYKLSINHSNVCIESGVDLPTSPLDWRGNDYAWDRILSKYWTGYRTLRV
jgi:Putative papain-like cysteine peptidase (DUF1796)